MKKKLFMTIVVIAGLAAAILVIRGVKDKLSPPLQRASDAAKANGNPRANIKIVEYTDFQCPACARGAQEVAGYFAQHKNDVYWEYRPYPLTPGHRHSFRAAVFGECAARQGKFWGFHDLVFARQKEWGAKDDPEEDFMKIAEEAGLAKETLLLCVKDPEVGNRIVEQKEEGARRGVKATPTYFLNGKMVVGFRHLLKELGVSKQDDPTKAVGPIK